jgi:phosphoribosylglycinamide formyltransferase-1
MRVLAPPAIQRFPNRIINIHPSLLPAFPGAHAVRDALEFGAKVTGVTIHFVDEHLDHGPIICQAPVAIVAGDDEESLHARIQAVEHRLLPQVVTDLALGHLEVSGRIVKGRVTT